VALERRRPLPAGRYWLDVFPKNAIQWQTWSEAMTKMGSATVETTEHYPSVDGAPEHDFVIFSTSGPNVAWEAAGLPSPTVAPSNITTSDDTATKPPPEPSALEQLGKTAEGLTTGLKVAVGVVVVVSVAGLGIAILRK
jgi:hypothetical protein